ncbi:hypothetical protein ACLB2K_008170 [Fragaria x ananassa]
MKEREYAKYQMIVSSQHVCNYTVPIINLDEEESEIEIELTEEDSGRTTSSLGMYSYMAKIKNRQRRPARRDDIYWWGKVKKTREKKAKEIGEGHELTEYGDVIQTIGDDEMEPMPLQIVATTASLKRTKTRKVV